MPVPVDFLVGCALFLFLAVGLTGAVTMLVPLRRRAVSVPVPFRRPNAEAGHRRCRYCRLGRAELLDVTAKVEDDDLVEVRTFVCRSCGLPQWTVERSSVLRKAAP